MPAKSIEKLPLVREIVPKGMLPEDPLTSFYEHDLAEQGFSTDPLKMELFYVVLLCLKGKNNSNQNLEPDVDRGSSPFCSNYYCSTEPTTSTAAKENMEKVLIFWQQINFIFHLLRKHHSMLMRIPSIHHFLVHRLCCRRMSVRFNLCSFFWN